MKTFLYNISASLIAGVPPKAIPIGDITGKVPFRIGNGDRLLLSQAKGASVPFMGLRAQYDIVEDRQRTVCMVKQHQAITKELTLYKHALAQINTADSPLQNTRSEVVPGARVFLFEIIPSAFSLHDSKENHFEIYDDVDFLQPFKWTPQIKFVAPITHMPFVPATNDVFCPFKKRDDDPRNPAKKAAWYVGAMRWWDQNLPDVVCVFAYKLGEQDERINGYTGTDDTERVLLTELSASTLVTDLVVSEPRDITYLDFMAARCDYFRAGEMEKDVMYCGEHRKWDAHHPHAIHVLARQVRGMGKQVEKQLKRA